MESAALLRSDLSEATCRQFAALAVLDRLVVEPGSFHAALLDGDDAFLEPAFDTLLQADLVAIDDDDRYRLTPLGRVAYQRMLHQQQSYLAHFDIFGAVDLAEGVFAEPDGDYLDDPRWADLRVAVAEFKGIDPYRLVFLSMLAGGQFFENPGWKFDLALGSSFFRELQEIVQSQVGLGELGYEDEDGAPIAGEDVLTDVILQGARINQTRLGEARARQPSLLDEAGFDEGASEPADDLGDEGVEGSLAVPWVPYDAWGPAAAYASSATFVERSWLDPLW